MVKLSLSKFQSFLQDSFLERDIQNEDNITNFIEECSEEDIFIISKIKSTFPCWSKEIAIEVLKEFYTLLDYSYSMEFSFI